MSRLMSVAMTTDAVIERRKTVTRRKGWWLDKNGRRLLRVGDTLTLCRKVQGRKPGEPIERLAEVEVVRVERHRLDDIFHPLDWGFAETEREGFPGMEPGEFVRRYFVDAQGMTPFEEVTRIEWRYVCGSGFCECGGVCPVTRYDHDGHQITAAEVLDHDEHATHIAHQTTRPRNRRPLPPMPPPTDPWPTEHDDDWLLAKFRRIAGDQP